MRFFAFTVVMSIVSAVLTAGEAADDIFGKKYALIGPGDRDPFTIWKIATAAPEEPQRRIDTDFMVRVKDREGTASAAPTTRPVEDVSSLVNEAYELLYRGDYAASIKKCEEALSKLEDPARQTSIGSTVQDRCLRIHKAAKKLLLRKEVEDEFAKLPILIEGIVWRPQAAFAVIGNRTCQVGDIVQGARIHQINPYDVVFIYKGLKVSKELFEGGKQDAGKAPSSRRK